MNHISRSICDGRLVLIEEDPHRAGILNSDPRHAYWTVGYAETDLDDDEPQLKCWSNLAPTMDAYMVECPKNWVLI